jgi:RNA polymerase sigma-70 factor (ECF subfamily)
VSASPTKQNECGGTRHTLGDLLYADPAKIRVSEAEWTALVRSIAGGDQMALRELYERSHRLVFTLALRITRNRLTADEVTLDVFHDVWRRASTYDAESGTVLGWIMNQTRSRAIDRLRFDQRKKRLDAGGTGVSSAESTDDTFGFAEHQDHVQLLERALTTLTREERQAIETAFFSEQTYAEVADRLQEPLGTIKTRIRSGLMKLRRALMQESVG